MEMGRGFSSALLNMILGISIIIILELISLGYLFYLIKNSKRITNKFYETSKIKVGKCLFGKIFINPDLGKHEAWVTTHEMYHQINNHERIKYYLYAIIFAICIDYKHFYIYIPMFYFLGKLLIKFEEEANDFANSHC